MRTGTANLHETCRVSQTHHRKVVYMPENNVDEIDDTAELIRELSDEVAAEDWPAEALDTWVTVRAAIPDLDGAAYSQLVVACRLLSKAASFDEAVGTEYLVEGYRGSRIANPLIASAQRARRDAASILARLSPVASKGAAMTNTERARRAAAIRWSRQ